MGTKHCLCMFCCFYEHLLPINVVYFHLEFAFGCMVRFLTLASCSYDFCLFTCFSCNFFEALVPNSDDVCVC
jgi:hypothetical protein